MKAVDVIFAVLKVALALFCATADAQTVSQQLRTQGQLYTSAADTLDSQAATIGTQAAKIAELEARVAELRGDLQVEDFTFLGAVKIPAVGLQSGGLAYDPAAKIFYTIGAAGNNPFTLCSFQVDVSQINLTTPATAYNVVSRGPLNVNDQLKMAGKASVHMRGLLWDRGRLLLNYCSYYSNQERLPFLAWCDPAAMRVDGPWTIGAAVHSDRAKGMPLLSPPKLAAATGQRYLSFNFRISTPQLQSFGLGLAAIGEPALDQPALTDVPGSLVSHWPMKTVPGITPIIPYGDYPPDPLYPVVYLQRQADGTVTKTPIPATGNMQAACFVGPNTLFVVGVEPWGHQWYGNNLDFQDTPSLVDPTKMTIGSGTYRGVYVERYIEKCWLVRVDDIIAKYQAGDLKVAHYLASRLSTLGGAVPIQSNQFGQPAFDAERNLLFLLNQGGSEPRLLVWRVKL